MNHVDSSGRETSTTDPLGRVQNFRYDRDSRLTGATWLAPGGATTNLVTYTYDPAGNLLSEADYAGTYVYTYDALNRPVTQAGPFALTLTYVYDAADRTTSLLDSLGGVLNSFYDVGNQLTRRQFGGSGQTPWRIDLGYDSRNELTRLTRYRDLAGAQRVGTTAYTFDNASRVTSIVHKNASAATLSYYNYVYDNADRVTSQSWQSGTMPGSAIYTYDTTNQLTSDGTTAYSYDLNGNRTMAGYETAAGNRLTSDGVWTYTYRRRGERDAESEGRRAGDVVLWLRHAQQPDVGAADAKREGPWPGQGPAWRE